MPRLNISDLAILQGLLYAIEPMLKLNDRLPLRCLQTFLMVGFNEGHSGTWYAKKIGIRRGSMSRNLLDIGPSDRYGDGGYRLVDARRNPHDMREFRYYLTPKGRALLNGMLNRIRPAA